MRNLSFAVSFTFTVVLASIGGGGCGDDVRAATGAAGRGGGAGSVATAGAGGSAGGAAGAGSAVGTGGDTAHSPEEIHDGLINAQTTGGVEVTRPQPAYAPPACD